MDTRGRLGAVACIQKVRNPVLVARAIADTPHYLMAGDGALRLARALGHQPFYSVTGEARKNHVEMLARLESDKPAMPALLGRVGDTALVGSGYYAGPHGAIAATGVGEHIIRHMLAREVYQWIADGMPLSRALQRGVDLIDKDVDIGLIGVTRTAQAACSNRDMPHAVVGHG